MKIYTRKGDTGETGLLGGGRVAKDDARIEAYGTVDELNAAIGLARAGTLPESIDEILEVVQNDLFALGADLASEQRTAGASPPIGDTHVVRLEQAIDHHEQQLTPLRQFILPGGTVSAAELHLARTICRRAERRVVAVARGDAGQTASSPVAYLNRLSDLLFVLSRAANAAGGCVEPIWNPSGDEHPQE